MSSTLQITVLTNGDEPQRRNYERLSQRQHKDYTTIQCGKYDPYLVHSPAMVWSLHRLQCFSKWSVPRGVEEMQGGGRRVRLEWEAYITV
ncbi:hypothetical protein FHG87_003907 [Trinorchestia longiramus]|nr:hypothetical protein FHG87_003907 [Trinorchestia longiramus]